MRLNADFDYSQNIYFIFFHLVLNNRHVHLWKIVKFCFGYVFLKNEIFLGIFKHSQKMLQVAFLKEQFHQKFPSKDDVTNVHCYFTRSNLRKVGPF